MDTENLKSAVQEALENNVDALLEIFALRLIKKMGIVELITEELGLGTGPKADPVLIELAVTETPEAVKKFKEILDDRIKAVIEGQSVSTLKEGVLGQFKHGDRVQYAGAENIRHNGKSIWGVPLSVYLVKGFYLNALLPDGLLTPWMSISDVYFDDDNTDREKLSADIEKS
jgi:hypothetical protein